jgi:hypothetical protein
MTRECPPQEFEHAKTKNLPNFQQIPTNVFLFFWEFFWPLGNTQKKWVCKGTKGFFWKKMLNVTTF